MKIYFLFLRTANDFKDYPHCVEGQKSYKCKSSVECVTLCKEGESCYSGYCNKRKCYCGNHAYYD